MGCSTRYLGSLQIDPPLNTEETAWLRSFHRSHRSLFDDPYEVPMNPGVVPQDHPVVTTSALVTAYSVVEGDGGPSPCDWGPSVDGRRLIWVAAEKSNNARHTLQFLIDHFLRPGAHAQADGSADFGPFTFDHVVSGTVAAERDDGKLFLLVAEDNGIDEVILEPGAGIW